MVLLRDTKKIEFRDANQLHEIQHKYSVAPHQPGRLCTSATSTSILLYEDRSKHMCDVRWLECAFSPPKPAVCTNVTNTKQGQIWDMCCVQHRQKELLVTTRGFDGGVYGYNTTSGELEWRMKCKLPGVKKDISPRGVTTDGRGNIYVCDDSNECIQLFSVDGVYNGSIMKEGKPSLGEPCRIRWCYRTSSMVVAHIRNKHYRISKIQGTADDVPGLSAKDINVHVDLTGKKGPPELPQPSTSTDTHASTSTDTVIILDSPTKETPCTSSLDTGMSSPTAAAQPQTASSETRLKSHEGQTAREKNSSNTSELDISGKSKSAIAKESCSATACKRKK